MRQTPGIILRQFAAQDSFIIGQGTDGGRFFFRAASRQKFAILFHAFVPSRGGHVAQYRRPIP
ncbi:MAG: hypothetical protein EOP63_08890 [Sphingomonadales bacterium]|nr:MAG: hypothetical protein EOP63_08890 [Sphingomonadales bacterium]